MKKRQKLKSQQTTLLKDQLNNILLYGVDREKYLHHVKLNKLDRLQEYMEKYDNNRDKYLLNDEQLAYVQNLKKYIEKNKDHKITIYYPLLEVVALDIVGKVGCIVHKTLHDFTWQGKEGKKQYIKGQKDGFVLSEVFQQANLVMCDQNTNEVLTKHTDFKEIEVEKVRTETKIIKQEVGKKITPEKFDKIWEKALKSREVYCKRHNVQLEHENALNELKQSILKELM